MGSILSAAQDQDAFKNLPVLPLAALLEVVAVASWASS
jgi:hypothetical protein